jgi:NAD(P)H-quinone oxidoreductase subunit 5
MFPLEQVLLVIVATPGLSFLLLGLAWLLGLPLRERLITRLTSTVFLVMLAATIYLGWSMFSGNLASVSYRGGSWFEAGEYTFQLDLLADRLSLPLMALDALLVGLVGLFSKRYLHREAGFARFFILLHLFAFGSMLVFASQSFDLLIGGWELVGISSAFLVAFFHQRRDPVRSALHMFCAYKVGDLGLLLAVFVLHFLGGTADGARLFPGDWPHQSSNLTTTAAALAGLLFLFAASAKSAQVPFFGWLPRAMEGPTPSSAIFYGAISIHAGAYLLLRIEPALTASMLAAGAVIAIGSISALVGTLMQRVVADAKSSIAYAAMTQLGIIFVEIGLGYPQLALIHIIGHATVRTLQFLRAPSMLHDYHRVHAAAGGHLAATGDHYERLLPESVRLWVYRFALDRGFYDALVQRIAVAPVMGLSRWLGSFEPGAAALKTESAARVTEQALEETKA